eukprot:874806_1
MSLLVQCYQISPMTLIASMALEIFLKVNMPPDQKNPSSSREEIIKPDGPLAEFRFQCGKFINHPYVEHFITFIIFCNTVILILSTFDIVEKNAKRKAAITVVDFVFLSIFSVES